MNMHPIHAFVRIKEVTCSRPPWRLGYKDPAVYDGQLAPPH